jgi:hypothetical protein
MVKIDKNCYYCGNKTDGGRIEEPTDKTKPFDVDICDKCLIEHGYKPEEYKGVIK